MTLSSFHNKHSVVVVLQWEDAQFYQNMSSLAIQVWHLILVWLNGGVGLYLAREEALIQSQYLQRFGKLYIVIFNVTLLL